MPTIPTTDIFPSVKLLSTDHTGDLQEVASAPPAKAKKNFFSGDILVEALEGGIAGNDISLTITDNSGFGADVVKTDEKDITIELTKPLTSPDAGLPDSLVYNGYLSLVAKKSGDSNIQLNIIDDVDNGFAVTGSAASGTLGGVSLTAVSNGVAGGNISLEIIDLGGGGGADSVVVTGNDIVVTRADIGTNGDTTQEIEDAINGNADASALVSASGGDATPASVSAKALLSSASDAVAGVDDVADKDQVKIAASDSDINVCLVNDILNYTNSDIKNLLNDSGAAWFADLNALVTVTVSNGAAAGTTAITGTFDFAGGADPANQSNTINDIINLINGDPDASALVVASLETANGGGLPSLVVKTNLEGGLEAITADLEPSSQFVCIKVDDIHSLKAEEIDDGRKLFWGVLESYTQVATGLSVESQPENLIVTRGQPALVIDAAGTRIRQAYSVQSFYATGDFDLEDETSL
jgi:hypothetical protein